MGLPKYSKMRISSMKLESIILWHVKYAQQLLPGLALENVVFDLVNCVKPKTPLLKPICLIREMLKSGDILVCYVFKQIESLKPNRVSNSLPSSLWTMKNY